MRGHLTREQGRNPHHLTGIHGGVFLQKICQKLQGGCLGGTGKADLQRNNEGVATENADRLDQVQLLANLKTHSTEADVFGPWDEKQTHLEGAKFGGRWPGLGRPRSCTS